MAALRLGLNRQTRLLLLRVGALALTYLCFSPLQTRSFAQTCSPTFGPFAIDGLVGDTNGNACNNSGLAPGATKTTDPNGNVKELGPVNASTTKVNVIHVATPPMLDFTNPNSQTDLNTIYTQAGVSSGQFFFYFGWARDANSGSGFISIELQRNAKPVACNYEVAGIDMKLPMTAAEQNLINTCNPWATRSDGDLLFTWDQQGNSTQVYVRTFDAALNSFGPAFPLGSAQALAQYSADLFRGEVAINLSLVVGGIGGQCLTFANIIPGTVTGNSDTADYKDTVLSTFPVASNCGAVTVVKRTIPAGGTGPFDFTLATSPSRTIFGAPPPHNGCTDNSTTSCASSLAGDGASDTIADLLEGGDFTLAETNLPSNYQLDSIVCVVEGNPTQYTVTSDGTFPVQATRTTTCTITNSLRTGQLRIIKTVRDGFGLNDPPGAFRYTLDGAEAYFTDDRTITGTSCGSGQLCRTETFNFGSMHTVLEQTPLAGYTVSYSSTASGHANDCNNLPIGADPVTCTVTNTATQNTPSAVTRQRVLLFDRAQVSGLRRTAGDAGTMTFKFIIYGSLDACTADTAGAGPGLGTQTVPIASFASGDPTQSTLIGTTDGVEVKLDVAGTLDQTYWWRALFHQNVPNPPNADYLTPCTETTRVILVQ